MIAHSVALDHNPNIGRYRYFITSCSTGIEALMRSKTVVVESGLNPSLLNIFVQFFLVGAQAFGGHAALAAQIQTEVVSRQRWLSLENFNLSVGLAMLLPGPMAVNVVSNGCVCGTDGLLRAQL